MPFHQLNELGETVVSRKPIIVMQHLDQLPRCNAYRLIPVLWRAFAGLILNVSQPGIRQELTYDISYRIVRGVITNNNFVVTEGLRKYRLKSPTKKRRLTKRGNTNGNLGYAQEVLGLLCDADYEVFIF